MSFDNTGSEYSSSFTNTDETLDSSFSETEPTPPIESKSTEKSSSVFRIVIYLSLLLIFIVFILFISFFIIYLLFSSSESDDQVDEEQIEKLTPSLDYTNQEELLSRIFRFNNRERDKLLSAGYHFFEATVEYYCCPESFLFSQEYDECKLRVSNQKLQIPATDASLLKAGIDMYTRTYTRTVYCVNQEDTVEVRIVSAVKMNKVFDCTGKCTVVPFNTMFQVTSSGSHQVLEEVVKLILGGGVNEDMKYYMKDMSHDERVEYVREEYNKLYDVRGERFCGVMRKKDVLKMESVDERVEFSSIDREFSETVMEEFCRNIEPMTAGVSELGKINVELACTADEGSVLCKTKEILGGLVDPGMSWMDASDMQQGVEEEE